MNPNPQMQPQPRKKSHGCLYTFLGGVGAVIILIVVIVAIAASGGSSDTGGGSDPAKTAKVGQAAKDGKFTFKVTKVRKGLSTYGDNKITQQHAQGQYVIINITVKNHGNEAQLFDATNQYLYDGNGRKYSAETGAMIENDVFLNQINPGNTVKGKIAFDMPKNRTPAKLELHDSAFSDGITVNLKSAR